MTFRGRRPGYGMHGDNQHAVDMAFHFSGSPKIAEAFLRYCWCVAEDLVSLWGAAPMTIREGLLRVLTEKVIEPAEVKAKD